MDLRTQTSLIACVLSFAIGGSVLLRPRKRRMHWSFIGFSAVIAIWYLTTFLVRIVGVDPQVWERINLLAAIAVPLAATQLFRAFVSAARSGRLAQIFSIGIAVVLSVLVLVTSKVPGPGGTPTVLFQHIVVRTSVFVYVTVSLGSALWALFSSSRTVRSKFERARLWYLALVGALAATFTIVDYLPYVGLDIPPIGTVLTLIFLYVLSQSILRYRLLDLYEFAGRLSVLTALAFSLAGIFWVLVRFAAGWFFLHSVVAAAVVFLLYDPVRQWVEGRISQIFFRERYDFETAVGNVRRRMTHVLELDELKRVLLTGLESSRRFTHASLYLADFSFRRYDAARWFGLAPPGKFEGADLQPLLKRLKLGEALVHDTLEREREEQRELGETREAEDTRAVLELLASMHAQVCVGLRGEQELYGFLCVGDDRAPDGFSPEEVQVLRDLALSAATAVENARIYQRMKERDRLAALGEMSAGLAHEIRNPLGAIKASAQYLAEGPDAEHAEFLGIIIDEANRLNNIVSSFLDYARPGKGDPSPTDVNAAVVRTMQIVAAEATKGDVRTALSLAPDLPPVRIDVEQLRQVLLNVVQNAKQAMEGEAEAELHVETALVHSEDDDGARRWIEIRVTDTGPGISDRVLQNLFVPFVTTKDRGTGLGLAISQRIVSAAHGRIVVRSSPGSGTTIVIRLPPGDEPAPPSTDARLDSVFPRHA